VPIRGARAEFPNHTLALPSCDTGRVSQLAPDCLCFNAERSPASSFGRISTLSRLRTPTTATARPHRVLSSAIDVHGSDVPALGPSIFLRFASALPAAKGLIVDYGGEVVDFAKGAGVGRILLVRSVGRSHYGSRTGRDRRLAAVHQRIRPRSQPSLGQAAR
jgi:hypothetical protein